MRVMLARSHEPFVGRVTELAALAEAYAQVSSGRAGIVFVEGPAGSGKTTLIRGFLTAAAPPVGISARGDKAEATLAWGGVSQPGRRASALRCGPLRHIGAVTPEPH